MNNTVRVLFFSLLSFSAHAQAGHGHNDCYKTLSRDESAILAQEHLDDSIAAHNVPAFKVVNTAFDAMPAGMVNDMQLRATGDHVVGSFSGLVNASHYLVLISTQEDLAAWPVNGIYYRPGELLGNSIVLTDDRATAFVAEGLTPGLQYYITVFAANSNSATGMLYNTSPAYKGKLVMKATAGLNYYFGNLHSHSSYSDGNKDTPALIPADDYDFAHTSLCMDFLGISEHNHFSATNNPGMHLADYQLGINQANQYTTDHPGFLALYGMEWGVINNGGHLLIYGVDSLVGWDSVGGNPNYDIFVGQYDYIGLNGIFRTINRFAHNKAFASFAHPSNTDYDSLRYIALDTAADNALVGSAVESGPAFSTDTTYSDDPNSMSYLSYFRAMLAKGYHIGPFVDHDNHYLTFGHATKARLAVLAPSIDKDDFFDAMRAMHFYATELCDTKIDLDVSGQMMGSIFTHHGAPAISIAVSNNTYPGTPDITIYKGIPGSGNNAVAIANNTGATYSYTDNALANDSTAYYYADIVMNGKRSITAPVWYTRQDTVAAVNTVPNLLLNSVSIKGNPVQDGILHLIVHAAQGQRLNLAISDIAGHVLKHEETGVVAGDNDTDMNMAGFAPGTYIVTIHFGDENISRVVVKQ